jgi:hypothetical protein
MIDCSSCGSYDASGTPQFGKQHATPYAYTSLEWIGTQSIDGFNQIGVSYLPFHASYRKRVTFYKGALMLSVQCSTLNFILIPHPVHHYVSSIDVFHCRDSSIHDSLSYFDLPSNPDSDQ